MSVTEDIVANADYHSRLLTSIAELDYAASALRHQASYVADLQNQLSKSGKTVEDLAKKTKKERKEHEQLRDSTARRLAHKLTGRKEKYEAKESKEEREYVEALEREMVERDNNSLIQQMLIEAQQVKTDLTQKVTRHESLKAEVDALYGRIFDGPSEPFPAEDRLEYDVHAAHKEHEQLQAVLNVESQAAELLARAAQTMDNCQNSVQEALSYSRYDMWGGGSMADMMERNALSNATAQATQVEFLVDQAIRICPKVQPVGRVNIAAGSMISDVFFDNIFTDMAFHDKIKNSAAQVLLANKRLKVERDRASQRAEIAGQQLFQAARTLEARRQELFALRRATFDSVVAHNPKPPSYDTVAAAAPASRPKASNQPVFLPPPGGPSATSSDNPATPDSSPPPFRSTPPTGQAWRSRNPYAAAMAERTRSMSDA